MFEQGAHGARHALGRVEQTVFIGPLHPAQRHACAQPLVQVQRAAPAAHVVAVPGKGLPVQRRVPVAVPHKHAHPIRVQVFDALLAQGNGRFVDPLLRVPLVVEKTVVFRAHAEVRLRHGRFGDGQGHAALQRLRFRRRNAFEARIAECGLTVAVCGQCHGRLRCAFRGGSPQTHRHPDGALRHVCIRGMDAFAALVEKPDGEGRARAIAHALRQCFARGHKHFARPGVPALVHDIPPHFLGLRHRDAQRARAHGHSHLRLPRLVIHTPPFHAGREIAIGEQVLRGQRHGGEQEQCEAGEHSHVLPVLVR